MGHSEGASGLCSIAKIVGMLQNGIIPANLHYSKPHYNMRNIREGRIQVIHHQYSQETSFFLHLRPGFNYYWHPIFLFWSFCV